MKILFYKLEISETAVFLVKVVNVFDKADVDDIDVNNEAEVDTDVAMDDANMDDDVEANVVIFYIL
ncbi:16743_t:CDS:2 [Dentiscutata heterogama]|uniref:16743_t:CDS:1 n=1 Tax=Dentiscutata heterogama TaxID=1316150 RepID=A0ACA9KS14_9GLOM|nr:16743_t:CDS:2 [Dentiscutata heterogama]